jgi:hypothetical protein
VTYEQIAELWNQNMLSGGFMKAPDNDPAWREKLAELIAVNPDRRDQFGWWYNAFKEIYDSDFASGRLPNNEGNIWRLELSTLLASEEKLQKLVTGRYRNREKIRDGPQFKPYEGPEDDYDPGIWDRKEN